MKEIRCRKCRKLLCKKEGGLIEIMGKTNMMLNKGILYIKCRCNHDNLIVDDVE